MSVAGVWEGGGGACVQDGGWGLSGVNHSEAKGINSIAYF